jgi:hypothetical protein
MTVVVRTHGGLGNQIFQIFFARLYARTLNTDYAELHDTHYVHKFARSPEICPATTAVTKRQHLISDFRFPKLLLRLRLRESEKITIFGDTFLDGYFQRASDYISFTDTLIEAHIWDLREELNIKCNVSNQQSTLYHIRLGDFFANHQEATAHALDRIEELEPGSTIISNQEEIFLEDSVQDKLNGKDCVLHSTTKYTSEDVLRLMSKYGRIVTNNSTLALWASVLGNCQTEFSDSRLAAVHDRFFRLANAR